MSSLDKSISRPMSSSRLSAETSMITTPSTVAVRTGGPRPNNTRSGAYERYGTEHYAVSHMPLDTQIHWTWYNPLNIIPATVLLLALIAIIATMTYL